MGWNDSFDPSGEEKDDVQSLQLPTYLGSGAHLVKVDRKVRKRSKLHKVPPKLRAGDLLKLLKPTPD
jgi:hypothetical protein